MRDLATDEAAIESIDIMIRETEERLTQLEQEEADRPGLCAESPTGTQSNQLPASQESVHLEAEKGRDTP